MSGPLRKRPSKRLGERAVVALCAAAALVPLAGLLLVVGALLQAAAPRLSWELLVGAASTDPATAGVLPALLDSLRVVAIAASLALPLGISSAIYVEEYLPPGRLRTWADRVLTHLAGVPSVVYGLLGLAIFVRTIGLRAGVLAGGATMALVVLPAVVLNTRDALRRVPASLREASYALGASRWRTLRLVVLPAAAPEIVGHAARALTRAIGEAAPLLIVGALGYGALARGGAAAGEPLNALPVQVFEWLGARDGRFIANAAAGMVVLLLVMLLIGALGLYLRRRLTRRLEV